MLFVSPPCGATSGSSDVLRAVRRSEVVAGPSQQQVQCARLMLCARTCFGAARQQERHELAARSSEPSVRGSAFVIARRRARTAVLGCLRRRAAHACGFA